MLSLADDRFELLQQVGEGGFGVVYEGRDRHTDVRIAVKLMQDVGRIADGRFEREAALLADVSHPSIVRYIAHGRASNGQAYLVMEWLEGETLEQRLKHRLLSVSEVLTLAARIVPGLAQAALRGVVHRDIKPANLFLVGGDPAHAKILDLGLARRIDDTQKLTRTGGIVGTPYYMSPEQARGEHNVDPRSDVFSLGSVLYECLCNDLPFEGSHAIATLAKICMEQPVPIEVNARHVPARLRELVHAMLAKARDERPTYRVIIDELAALAGLEGNAATPKAHRSPRVSGASETCDLVSSERSALSGGVEQRVLCAVFVRGVRGVEAWTDALDSELSKMAERHQARRERLLDGSLILVLEEQPSASDQAVTSALCALSLRQLVAGGVPIAICTGRARVEAQQPLLGELLERGVRMLWATQAGTIRVDEASAALLESRFELGTEVRDGSTVHSLLRERTGGEAPRTLLGQATRFVGRERELSQISLIFRECVEERVARPVLVTAPPGAGKSRLRYELVERLKHEGDGFLLLIARGDATSARTQFGVLSPAVLAWAGITAELAPSERRDRLRTCVAAVAPVARAASLTWFLGEMTGLPFADEVSPHLRAARRDPLLMAERMLESWLGWLEVLSADRPILLCVEDLHWSDPASVRFLDAALRSLADQPLMVLAFARPEVRESFPNLWAERDLTELRLSKLTARTCERLLDSVLAAVPGLSADLALRTWLVERADGNPFFLEELVRGIRTRKPDESLPDSILGIVQARLDALGEEPKLVIRAASVLGQQFSVAAVRELLGGEVSRLDLPRHLALLSEREVIFARGGVGDEQEYGFRHGLIRDAAYSLLEPEQRERAHRLAADWLESCGASPAVLAEHCERGGVRERASRHYAAAALQALDAGSLDDVVRCGERAVECGATGESLGEVASLLAEAFSYLCNEPSAARWSEAARTHLPAGCESWWRATQVAGIAYLRLGRSDVDELVSEMARHVPEVPILSSQMTALAYVGAESFRLRREDLGQRLFDLLPAHVPEALRGRAQGCVEIALFWQAAGRDDKPAALHHARESVEAFRRVGSFRQVAEMLGQSGFMLYELGLADEAEWSVLEEIQIGKRLGLSNDVAYGNLVLGCVQRRRKQLSEAELHLREAVRGFAAMGMTSFQAEALSALADVLWMREDSAGAEAALATAHGLGELEPGSRATLLAVSAKLKLASGDAQSALPLAQQAMTLMQNNKLYESIALIRTVYVDCLRANDRPTEADEALREAQAWLDEQAAKIQDLTIRAAYLTAIPENVRIFSPSEWALTSAS